MHVDWECLSSTLCIVYSAKLFFIVVNQVEKNLNTNVNTNVSTSKQPPLITLYNAECTLGAHHQSVVFAHCLPYVWLALYNLKITARVRACAKYVICLSWLSAFGLIFQVWEKRWKRTRIFAEGELGLNFLLKIVKNWDFVPFTGGGGGIWPVRTNSQLFPNIRNGRLP